MTGQITRAFAGDLHIRADGEGRTISGIVVPFDTEARVSDGGPSYLERFARGSFAKTIKERGDRVKLLLQHNSHDPIGKAIELREDAAGLLGSFRVSSVPAGDQAIELVRDGVLDSFSVGFAPVKHTREGEVTVRTEVALREASLVTFPAYDTARIHALRTALADLPEGERDALLRGITDRSKAQEEIEMFSYLMELTRVENEWIDEFMRRWAKRFPAVTASIGEPGSDDGVDHKAPTAVQRRTKPIRNTKSLQRIRRPKL